LNPSLLIDNSAWSGLGDQELTPSRRADLERLIVDGAIAVCLPFLLEAGYSARRSREHPVLIQRLLAMPRVHFDSAVEDLALDVQARLALSARHRLPPMDLMIAALADHHSFGLLHYDAHFDVILEHTTLSYESVWLAPQGSLA